MGRSRRRARASGAPVPTPAAPAIVEPRVLRKTLGAYLAGAVLIAILTLLGILILQGTLGPWLVLVVNAGATFGLFRWAQARLADLPLSDEDRIMQTLAGGLLAIVFLFAAVAAVVITASS